MPAPTRLEGRSPRSIFAPRLEADHTTTRRPRAIVFLMMAVISAVGAVGCTRDDEASAGPERIFLIVVDTLRRDAIGVYGGAVATPTLDRLAAEGQRFTRAVSASHMTPASMGGLFAGVTPSFETGHDHDPVFWSRSTWCGLVRYRDGREDSCLPERADTIAEALQRAGYWTVGVTANPLLFDPDGFSQGFEAWREVGLPLDRDGDRVSTLEHVASRTARAVNEAVFDVLADRPSDRFFLYAHYLDVHDYIEVDEPYEAAVARFDAMLGELIDRLEAESLLDDAVLVLTSDHGEVLGEWHPVKPRPGHRGNPSYQGVLAVPLIVRPAVFESEDALVRGEDLRDMLVSLTEADPDSPEATGEREHFVSEIAFQTYRRGRWKSIWRRGAGSPLLFDLEEDPDEKASVAYAYPDVLAEHRARIDELEAELGHTRPQAAPELDDGARERLRVLGYLDDEAPDAEALDDGREGSRAPGDRPAPAPGSVE